MVSTQLFVLEAVSEYANIYLPIHLHWQYLLVVSAHFFVLAPVSSFHDCLTLFHCIGEFWMVTIL